MSRSSLLWAGLACCFAWPAVAQIITPLPFGQRNSVVTPLPFGQRSAVPMRPLGRRGVQRNAAPMLGTVVAQWNMDETSGTTMVDSSGNGNNGTMYSIGLTGAGDGYTFNGSSSRVVVPSSPTLVPGPNDFSYQATIQTAVIPALGQDFDLIRKGASSTVGGGFRLELQYYRGAAVAYCSISDDSNHTVSIRGRTNLADNQPHTLTCQKTATGVTLVVDSFAPLSKTGTLGSITNNKALALGCKSPTCKTVDSDWYNGLMKGATFSQVVP